MTMMMRMMRMAMERVVRDISIPSIVLHRKSRRTEHWMATIKDRISLVRIYTSLLYIDCL